LYLKLKKAGLGLNMHLIWFRGLSLVAAAAALTGCVQQTQNVQPVSTSVSAAAPGIEDLGFRGEFVRTGPTLACKTEASPALTVDVLARIGNQPCLHFGPYAVGMEVAKFEASIGRPTRVINAAGLENRVYARRRDSKVDLGSMSDPYLVAGIKNNRVVSLQMTGPPMAEPLDFQGVTTYSPVGDLIARIGPPVARRPVEQLANVQGELWTYGPERVSFEVIRNRIYSIRIALPGF